MRSGDRIRVAMVHGPGLPERDGVSGYVTELIPALAGAGVEVTAVPLRRRPSSGWVAATRRAAQVLRRVRPHLIHVQFAPSAYRFSAAPGLLPLLLPAGTPLVTTVHEYGWWAAPGWIPEVLWRPVEAVGWWDRETGRLVPASAAVITTNSAHAAQVRRRTGIEPIHVPIAPNVAPHPSSPPRRRVRQWLGLPADAPVLAFFGFVHPVKGLRYLIEAAAALRTTDPGLHLLVIGGFTSQALPAPQAEAFQAELVDLARRHGVAPAVRFTGHLPAAGVSAVLWAADIGVLPFTHGVSTRSGALLAMLAHGIATAVTLTDPPDEALRDGDTVAVIPARRDAEAIVHTVRRMLDDPALTDRLARGALRMTAGHTWAQVAGTHRDLYRRILAGA